MNYTEKQDYLNEILEYTNYSGAEIADGITDDGIEWSAYICGKGARCLDYYLEKVTEYFEEKGYVEQYKIKALLGLADAMSVADIAID